MKVEPEDEARFALGHATAANWRAACSEAIAQLVPLPPAANMGFLYTTEHFAGDLADILDHIRGATAIDSWVGTVGAGILATGREYFGEPAIAIMVAAFPTDSFSVFSACDGEVSDIVAERHDWLAKTAQHFGVVHADPRSPDLAEAIPRFVEATNSFCVGGISSAGGSATQVADGVTEGGFSGVLFSGDVPVVTGLTQGCSPIGPIHEVTACEGNIAIELDGRPAFEVFCDDIGAVLARNLNQAGRYIHAAIPVAGSDRADYMVRNLIGLDPEAGLVAIGEHLTSGQAIMFCRRDSQSAFDDLRRMLADLKQRAATPPRGGIYYSCVARGPNMFGPDSVELETIRAELGDIPLVGFFCNGEISYDRLYGYTGVLSLFL